MGIKYLVTSNLFSFAYFVLLGSAEEDPMAVVNISLNLISGYKAEHLKAEISRSNVLHLNTEES